MKMMPVAAVMMLLFAFIVPNKLTGRWERVSPTGNVIGIVFKADSTFDAYINKKPFVSGTYGLQDSTFTIIDNGCPGVKGVFKMTFFSNNDSMRVELISDDCTERGKGMHNNVYGRVKK